MGVTALALFPAGAAGQEVVSQSVPPVADDTSTVIGFGGDISKGSHVVYGAITHALNGDLNTTGALVRASVAGGQYATGLTPFSSGSDVNFYSAGFMLGYQARTDRGVLIAGFVGPELVHNGSGADPRVEGTSWAARFVGEAYIPGDTIDFSVWSSYSTFENQYHVTGRALANDIVGNGQVGPELGLFGGDGWRRSRAGLHIAQPTSVGQIGLSAGFDFDLKSAVYESPYASVGVSFPF